MLRYEIKKVFSQGTVCVLLLILWALFCAVFIGDVSRIRENTVPSADADTFFELYLRESENVKRVMEERKAAKDEYERITMKMTKEEIEEYGPFVPEDRFVHSGRFTDESLYELLQKRATYTSSYASDLQNVIAQAKANEETYLLEGRSKDSYLFRYQECVIRSYEKVLSVIPAIGFENIHGWGTLFQTTSVDFFLVLSVILFSSCVFLQERTSGFQFILKTAKNGRRKTVVRKWAVLGLGTAFLTVFYVLTEAVVIGCFLGYSSGFNAVSAIEQFRFFPYPMTMFGFLAVFVLLKIIAAGLLSAVVAFVSMIAGKVETIYASGILFYTAGLLMTLLPEDSFLSGIGFVRTSEVSSLFHQAVYYRIFDFPVPCAVFNAVLYLLLTLVFVLLSFPVVNRLATTRAGRTRLYFTDGTGSAEPPRSLLRWESDKRMLVSRMLIVLAAVFVLQIVLSAVTLKPNGSDSEKYYREYLSDLHGPWSEASETYLANEKQRLNDAIALGETAKEYYQQGLIDDDEYDRIENEYFDAMFRKDAFERMERQAEYLDGRRNEERMDGWVIDTRRWELLFFGSGFYLILVWIVLLSSGMYAFEYGTKDGGFASILLSTKKGRAATFRAKIGAAAVLTAVGYLLLTAVNLFVFGLRFGWDDLNAPLCSIERFAGIDCGITVGGFLPLFLGIPLLVSFLLSAVVVCVSKLSKNTLFTLIVSTLLSFVVELIEIGGAEGAKHCNLLHLLSGSEAVRISAETGLFGWDFTELCIALTVCILLCGITVIVSDRFERKENRHASVIPERQ